MNAKENPARPQKLRRALLVAGLAAVLLAAAGFLIPDGRSLDAGEYFSDPATLALAEALAAGDGARARELVAAGADPDAQGFEGLTLLQWAVYRESRTALRLLLELGADPSLNGYGERTALHVAAQYQNTSLLEVLLDGGADPNAPDARTQAPPLFAALGARRQPNVDLLVERGADLERTDSMGATALIYAAQIVDGHNVRRFLELGADPLATASVGDTFQSYLFNSDPTLLHGQALDDRLWAIDFLRQNGIPLAPETLRWLEQVP